MRALAIFAALLTAIITWGPRADAHASPHSFVLLDFRSHDVAAELRLPVSELEVAWQRPLLAEQGEITTREAAAVRSYVEQYIHPTSRDGAAWSVSVGELGYRVDDEVPYLVVQTELMPPEGHAPNELTLDYDVVCHEVNSHAAWVAVRSDFAHGTLTERPTMVGVIRYLHKQITIDRTGGGNARGFRAVIRLGLQHIYEGTDHLLFLLALLLPASLLATRRPLRWGGYAGAKASATNLLRIVTAFTLGHSLTLLAGTIGWLHLPSAPVETLIAVSILVSAVHALRPIFPGREAWVAAGFGLVHGLAFAGALSEIHLDPYRLALTVLGFNLGIELMQLAVVALTFPSLVLLARTSIRVHAWVRKGGAVFVALAALGWIGQRALGLANPTDPIVNAVARHPIVIVLPLACLAAGATAIFRRRGIGFTYTASAVDLAAPEVET